MGGDDRVIGFGQGFNFRELLDGPETAPYPRGPDQPVPPSEAPYPRETEQPEMPSASAAPSALADDVELLPSPGDAYKAHSRISNKVLMTLYCRMEDGLTKGFAWNNYDGLDLEPASKPGYPPVLVLRFAGLKPAELVIEGRNLLLLHAYLGQGRIGWVWTCPKGKEPTDRTEAVITRMSLRPVQP